MKLDFACREFQAEKKAKIIFFVFRSFCEFTSYAKLNFADWRFFVLCGTQLLSFKINISFSQNLLVQLSVKANEHSQGMACKILNFH